MKKILLMLLMAVSAVITASADDFKILSVDPAADSRVAGFAAKGAGIWKFSSNMDSDSNFKAITYYFTDLTTGSFLYSTTATKTSKYANGVWTIKNYSNVLSDFKKDHKIQLKIVALDNEAPSQAQTIGADSITWIGDGTADYVYSPAEILSISPDAGTELKSGNDNTFVITFSQGVNIDKDQTHIVTGQMATAQFTSVTSNADKTVWTLVAPASVIESTTPALQFNVYGADLDGKTLQGNTSGAYRQEAKSYYKFKYDCLLGSPALTVTPAAGVVTSLKDFMVAYSRGIDLSYAAGVADITVTNAAGEVVATVSTKAADAQIKVDTENHKYAKFSLPSEITEEGKYTLNIPSKLFALGTEFEGYTSKFQTISYTIGGGALTATITPADGTELATMPNISVTFSDPAAVGYANYVITDLNPADPENTIIMSGDLKKQDDDTWATKYLSMYEIKLYEGHQYSVSVKAYASESDYNYGNDPMGTFSSTVNGTTVEFRYSDVTFVRTQPSDYSTISSGDFTAAFSDAVSSVKAEVIGAGVTGDNIPCEVLAGNDGNKTWKIIIPSKVIDSATGSINVNIVAKDAKDLYVHGNTYADPDTINVVTFNCYNGAPEYTISPATGSTVDKIDVLTCSYSGKINPGWSWIPGYVKKGDEKICEFTSDNVKVNDDSTIATVTLASEITEAGTYKVVFPATFFALGEEFDGCSSKEQSVELTIAPATGVSNVNADVDADMTVCYSLSGQRVNSNAKGIIIMNGRKIMK